MKFNSIKHHSKTIAAKKSVRIAVPAFAVLVIAAGFILAQQTPASSEHSDHKHPEGHEAHNEYLRSQVDTETGSPRDGRDPASQQQTSLASAASKPTGAGQRVDNPASGVAGDSSHHATSSDVYGDPSQTGIGSNGCYIDYGIQGEQCLPAHAATNGQLTCAGVRKHFPNGIKVTGTDRFHLDANHDLLACGAGD